MTPTVDHVDVVKDSVTGEDARTLSLVNAQDQDKLKSSIEVPDDDPTYLDRVNERIAQAAQWKQTLDVRDPGFSQPVVFVGGDTSGNDDASE